MEEQKRVNVARKVEALATGFVGICFFSMGTPYFQERLIYQMPRILVPVYELLGGTGLAVAMLLLGLGFIAWGFLRWRSTQASPAPYLILAVMGLAVGVFLANYNFRSSEDIMQDMEDEQQEQIEDVKQAARPDFGDADIDRYFDEFEALYDRLENNAANADSVRILNEEFYRWSSSQPADLLSPLDNDQKYEFSKYNARLSVQWSERVQAVNEN
jgi:hypothetical protein